MTFAVLGSGMQGTACAYDLAMFAQEAEVILTDADLALAEAAAKRLNLSNVKPERVDVTNHTQLVDFLKEVDVVVSAVPYFLNLEVTRAAIEAKTHMIDMGGNTDLVWEQRKLSDLAKTAGVTILPDGGLAPGMANLLAVHGMQQLDETDTVKIRVGGLPQNPQPPLNYQLFFSIHGLINEYIGKAVVLRDGRRVEIETLTELETLEFPQPVGACEAFLTLGGLSTLPWTFEGKVREMDYKTIRYPGHCHQIKTMADLGLLDEEPVQVSGQSVVPRDVFAACVVPRLTAFEDKRDIVLVRAVVTGRRGGQPAEEVYEIVDRYDSETGFTAMMRTTAFPVAIIAHMMADGRITERGVLPLETTVPTDDFLTEMAKRNIRVERKSRTPETANC